MIRNQVFENIAFFGLYILKYYYIYGFNGLFSYKLKV